jgi:GABA(A) receptor-associated protein
MAQESSYKKSKSIQARLLESTKIREKFPGRIPIIVERAKFANDLPLVDKNKYMCPEHFSIGQFIYLIRKRIDLPPEKALFVFVGNTLPMASQTISELYMRYRDADGFLYMTYTSESTFGRCSFLWKDWSSSIEPSPDI